MTDALDRISRIIAASGLDVGFAATAVERGTSIDLNGAALYPTASTFKVPVMVEIYAQARAGKFALADRVPFDERFRVIGSGVMQTLAAGLNPTIRDLMMLMTIVSDNTATDILCDLVGLANVTARMRALGLENIHLPVMAPSKRRAERNPFASTRRRLRATARTMWRRRSIWRG